MPGKLCYRTLLLLALLASAVHSAEPTLGEGWYNVPTESRLRAYWWWLNGNVTKDAITRDLNEFKAKGLGGVVLIDAGGAEQRGNAKVPHGPTFATPEWRELYKHALREANRLGLVVTLTIQSGWNLGGPDVRKEDAVKKIVWSGANFDGGREIQETLKTPDHKDGFYRDVAVVAFRVDDLLAKRGGLARWQEKGLVKPLAFSTPDVGPLLEEEPERTIQAGEKSDVLAKQTVIDLTSKLNSKGEFTWNAPPGNWRILRFGYTIADHAHVSTCSDGWNGYALDVLDHQALRRYWDQVVEPLLADAGPLAGKTLKYLYTDSWEIEPFNWTAKLPEEFRKRRGYDLLPYLPVLAGEVVESRDESNRFLFDFRKTLGEMVVDEHWQPLKNWAGEHHLGWQSESGGPHAVPIDAQQCLGLMDIPMAEFWAWSWEHRIGDANRFFIKQPASAAHTNGRRYVAGEGFTTIGPHWQERIWDNLKPSFDKAACEGLNLLVWHAMVCSPDEAGLPGNQYFAGTHFNPGTTWWEKSGPFLNYINRCQWMLQQGNFVADVCYYYGDNIPNFTQRRATDPAQLGPGYDYDVITTEVLVGQSSVEDGKIKLPSGMTYRLLVLHNRPVMSPDALKQVQKLVQAGATVVGERPKHSSGLAGYEANERELIAIADELWGPADTGKGIRSVGKGRVAQGLTAREVLEQDGVGPDFFVSDPPEKLDVSYIHRRTADADIYFVANFEPVSRQILCNFRNPGISVGWMEPVTGASAMLSNYQRKEGVTRIHLQLSPCGSVFIVFGKSNVGFTISARQSIERVSDIATLDGPWQVAFDPKWGGPESVEFPELKSWTEHDSTGIKYYSGTATYKKKFTVPANEPSRGSLWLDLGDVRELAEVKVDGQSLGTVWCPPFRVELSGKVQPGEHELKIEVVNFWPNRIIGDQSLPEKVRLTKTNIRKLTSKTPLTPSGLLGPVNLLRIQP
jgi:hypothetical protein